MSCHRSVCQFSVLIASMSFCAVSGCDKSGPSPSDGQTPWRFRTDIKSWDPPDKITPDGISKQEFTRRKTNSYWNEFASSIHERVYEGMSREQFLANMIEVRKQWVDVETQGVDEDAVRAVNTELSAIGKMERYDKSLEDEKSLTGSIELAFRMLGGNPSGGTIEKADYRKGLAREIHDAIEAFNNTARILSARYGDVYLKI